MDYIKVIEKMLKEYRKKRAKVDNSLATIQAWEESLENPDVVEYLVRTYGVEMGMPTAKYKITSPQEVEILRNELEPEEAAQLVREWIKDEYSRIFKDKLEVEAIERALSALTPSQKYVIELKYFDEFFWSVIEDKYNERFREKNYVTEARLRQIDREALNKLTEILIRQPA